MIAFTVGPWVEAIGYKNTFLSTGFLALAVNLILIPMIFWGKKFRVQSASRYARMAEKQFDTRHVWKLDLYSWNGQDSSW